MLLQVSALYYYPIKSCAGSPLKTAVVTPTGFEHDRMLMVIDEHGDFLTQREAPRMALIQPHREGNWLTLNAPNMPELELEIRQQGQPLSVIVWRSTCQAIDQGQPVARWLQEYLGMPARLVAMAEHFARPVNPAYARTPQDQVSFADGYPYLLLSEASLADLNTRLAQPLPMNRFRPNLVLTGCAPYAEDDWQEVVIGTVPFTVAKPCARCVIITTDQTTAQTGPEPLRTLATYRNVKDKGVLFGQNLIAHHQGLIKLGDKVMPTLKPS